MATAGGRILEGILKELEGRIADYHGMLNQRRAGLKIRPDEVVQKPPELVKYEQMLVTGLPMWDGGLQDQPHIWLHMLGVIVNMVTLQETLAKASESQKDN